MSSPVYSTLLIEATSVSINAGYTVPAGYTVIVRDICVFLFGAPDDSEMTVLNEGTQARIYAKLYTSSYEYDHWVGHQVFPAGSTIQAIGDGPTEQSVRISGYLLSP